MYELSRWCLRIGFVGAWGSVACLILLIWPVSIVVIGFFVLRAPWKTRWLVTLGSARWATLREVEKAGMTDASSGLILGRLCSKE